MQRFSYLKSTNADYIDEVFERYLQDPDSVDPSWKYLFEGLELGADIQSSQSPVTQTHAPAPTASADLLAEAKVAELIQLYRERGKFGAQIDPLSPAPSLPAELQLEAVGLSASDLTRTFHAGKLLGMGAVTLREITDRLKAIYCSTTAVEFSQVENRVAKEWLQKKIETAQSSALSAEDRKFLYRRLVQADGFERFLHTRYVAQKRFSVEGGDALIPALDLLIERGADFGATEFVIGMAHRGRLNVLTHILGKPYEQMFTEFEGTYKSDPADGEGDVKYHKGFSRDFETRKGKEVHLSLAFNPSHLEFVNPVVEGMVRARQDRYQDRDRIRVVPVLIHGDAALAGQGVCFETLQMQGLKGYATGGTIHLVVNNQVGFTTSPIDSRTATYSTDLAKVLSCPVLHVNGDDVEAVVRAVEMAIEYKQKFKGDFFIDLVCYRKHGHNEGDEPTFTQPVMYKKIKTHPSPREIYANRLIAAGVLTTESAQALVDEVTATMNEAQKRAKAEPAQPHVSTFENVWKGLKKPTAKDITTPVKTQVPAALLKELSTQLNSVPKEFQVHPKLTRFLEARQKAIHEAQGIDWGNAESLAFATLLHEGHTVRITGQDAERGTFSHRNAVLNDFETGQTFCSLRSVATKNAQLEIYNSLLSETAVMGFEYGYALSAPQALVIWEAQFGDFANGAQVMIDQFIATSESKWQRMNGLVLLLPHGYAGQGPEHSSARLERFLQLCGRDNMIVANLSTPAQIFHALRRQVKRDFRKPLVVMSPKGLLRHALAVSNLSELTDAGFQEVLDCPHGSSQPSKVQRVLLCSGQVYYDLVQERIARKRDDVAIVRIEQLYPWPAEALAKILNTYTSVKEFVWVQEEPRNMGAWSHVFGTWMGGLADFAENVGGRRIRYVGRGIAASPAVGSPKVHESELKTFLNEAFQ